VSKEKKTSKSKAVKPVSTTPKKRSKAKKTAVKMVAIGASAGGLEPFEKFFDSMPVDSGLAFSVIQHLSPDFESMMDELLSRHSSMDIKRVVDGLAVKPNTIYLNPPRSDMVVKNGKFKLSPRVKSDQLNLPIDVFFTSLAAEYGDKSIAIILSGTGKDGTRGAALVKEANGTVLVQSPASAKFDGMPRSIIESGNFDAIGAPAQLPSFIERLLAGKSLDSAPDEDISDDPAKHAFNIIQNKFGTDFGYYKEATLRRRFERRAQLFGQNQESYARSLEGNSDELDALYADLLIDVTAFFRDPKGFEAILKHAVYPLGKKMTHDRQIRVWIPGCSSGEEAYSFAIAFAEYARENNLPLNLKIMATDIHQRSLGAASQGIYPKENLKGLSEDQIERYFEKHVDYYQINQNLRRLVVFSQHNLLRDPPFTRMDIVSCRNVLIYFLEEAQRKTIALFHFALAVNGVLFLGPSESLGHLEDEFDTLDRRWNIFKKLRDTRLVEATSLLPRDSKTHNPADISVPFLTGRSGTLQRFQRAHSEALEHLVKQYAPSGFLLNKRGEVIHVFGGAGDFVRIDGGIFSNKIIDLIDPQLRLAVTTGLEQLSSAKKRNFERRVIVSDEDKNSEAITLSLRSMKDSINTNGHVLLTLESTPITAQASKTLLPKYLDNTEASSLLRHRIADLEADLQATEESLQSMVEELQTSNEELQATNEELMASNEELQSTNEELHSVNEELYTVSAEHQRKIDELTVLTDDMNHLLKATSIGIVFLDENSRIRRFTPSATAAFNLLPQDVGRPFGHTTYRFDSFDLEAVMAKVIKSETAIEKEITVDDKDYFLSILPYKTSVKDASGVVMTLVDVSEVKRANQKRMQEKVVFETAINELSEAIVRVDLESGNVELSNDIFAGYYGKKANDIIGKPFEDVVGEQWPIIKDKVLKNLKPAESFNEQVIMQDGPMTGRVISRTIRAIGDTDGNIQAIQGVRQDITEQYRYAEALEALIEVEDPNDVDFDAAINRVLEIGCNYLGLSFANSSRIVGGDFIVEHVFGHGKEGLKPGDTLNYEETFVFQLPNAFDPLTITNVSKSAFKGKSCNGVSIETFIGLKTFVSDGSYGAISFSDPKVRKSDFTPTEKTMTQLLARMVSAFIERKKQADSLDVRQVELENVNEGLKRFTYLASHDLQEPLRKIQQSGELLDADYGELLNEEGKYFLEIMTSSAGRMRTLIEDLLLYSASANDTVEKDWVPLETLVQDALSELSVPIERQKAKCTVKPLPIAACDKTVMTQVFINIIGNSLKYTTPEKHPIITVSSKALKNSVKVEIRDNGIGMTLKESINIFEPFTRLHSKSEYSGSGIGLAICKSICARHGWKIDAKSEQGKGTTMIITIPTEDIQEK
jgi:two-component system CheB/CheR fusion protein